MTLTIAQIRLRKALARATRNRKERSALLRRIAVAK